ncbi:DNA translocase FtsK [Futiania mangrovi]|uniref:DNA translocase FtsK n=1 Tax=Futiania mangrovi TaxID=2959716 RepID=A0A9J6PFE9_9PROT|nr:DNA translocase FtsK [Futiania mangrovii]MCP1336523.1 DNA translocase FtsK 4TM domain-containing protein [Futiania mangrovii]
MARTRRMSDSGRRGARTDEGLRAFLRRRAGEGAGLLMILLAVFIALALASYDPADPSPTHAAPGPVSNLAGTSGAYVADLLLQTLGLGALAVALSLVVWGVRLLTHVRARYEAVRVAAWPLGVLGLAAAFAFLPAPDAWPIRTGLGGHLGALIAHALDTGLSGWVAALPLALIRAGVALAAAAVLLLTLGLQPVAIARRLWTVGRGGWRSLRGAGDLAADASARLGEAARAARRFLPRRSREDDDAPRPRRPREPVLGPAHGADAFGADGDDAYAAAPLARTEGRSPREAGRDIGRDAGREKEKPARKARKAVGGGEQRLLALDGGSPYALPSLNFLAAPGAVEMDPALSPAALQENSRLLEGVLDDFGVKGDIIGAKPGPVVTLYELEPAPGLKSSRVINLADDIARSMSAISARVAVIPGRNAIGVELPNRRRQTVYLRELLASREYEQAPFKLALALGKTIGGESVIADLARMPHLLVAGTTGSGKSVAINTMVLSLLYRLPPDQVKLIMIDPKMLELSVYDGIPHLLAPVVTDPKKAVVALKWVVREMEDRYRKMSKLGVRNIAGYNQRMGELEARGETLTREIQTGFDPDTGRPTYEEEEIAPEKMPFIVVIVDEMADLMMVAGKDVEGSIQRLAQMARAAGIHLVMATQRPSVDVITGTIKANFPTRISFQVTSKIDSRTILGEQGAEQLLGQGDMLYMEGGGRIRRVHGPFVSDTEVEEVVAWLKAQGSPDYLDAVTEDEEDMGGGGAAGGFDDGDGGSSGNDPLFDQAVAIVAAERKASTSYLQRRLQIGYNRAARIVEEMEEQGIIGRPNHVGRREILVRDPNED